MHFKHVLLCEQLARAANLHVRPLKCWPSERHKEESDRRLRQYFLTISRPMAPDFVCSSPSIFCVICDFGIDFITGLSYQISTEQSNDYRV